MLALALLLRLFVVWNVAVHEPAGWLYQRGIEMGLLAKTLLAGQGLSSPFGPPTGPTAFIAPGYPILVAGVFRLFGIDTQPSEVVLMLINVAANLVTVWLIMHIARKLFGQGAALAGGIFWACSPPLLWIPSIFWDTSLAIALLTGFVALALRLRARPTRGLWIVIGLYAAITVLLTPAFLFAFSVIFAWMVWATWPTQRMNALLATIVFAIAFSPWPIRNARVFHAFIPLRTTVGFELWMGNRDQAKGFLDQTIFPMYNQHELELYKQQGEIAYTDGKAATAKAWIAAHPAAFVRMSVRRFWRFWSGTGTEHGSLVYMLHALLTTLLGFGGLWVLYRRGARATAVLFLLPLLIFPCPYYITHAEFRYRLLIDPLLTILAAGALIAIFKPQPAENA